MVSDQLRARDITDTRVLDAMLKVPRHLFVPEPQRTQAYGDHPLPIGHDQTISQPYIVAFMTQGLKVDASHRVLEIGTGSGYQAAILGLLAKEVYTIEIIEPLATRAGATLAGQGHQECPRAPRQRLSGLAGARAVRPNHGHGSAGRSAAGARQQLRVGGLMAIPVGTFNQELRIMRRTATGLETLETLPVRFVPMTGKPKPVPAR